MPRPFLKWVGGKGQLLTELFDAVDAAGPFHRYHEPLVGGGALFFELARTGRLKRKSYLCDVNENLMEAYAGVRDQVNTVVKLLESHKKKHCSDYFYEVRAKVPSRLPQRAARIIYLNKTCFNGLYRENSRGLFNAPLGRYTNPAICDEVNLRAVSKALVKANIETGPFQRAASRAKEGDLVYFDPPYHPRSKTAYFTSYSKQRFDESSQRALAETFAELSRRGVKVVLSNSMTDLIVDLYKDFYISEVFASRLVNSKAEKRGKISEVLVTSFPMEGARAPRSRRSPRKVRTSPSRGAQLNGNTVAQGWLRQHGYDDVAALIDEVTTDWKERGVSTRRNWWEVLAGGASGKPRTVAGRTFPVLRAAQLRQAVAVTPNALARESNESMPKKPKATSPRRPRKQPASK